MESATILLIEDHDDTRELYAGHMRAHGLSVVEARDVDEGLAYATKAPPTVVVTDIGLPHRSGIEALQEIRRLRPSPRIPVIAITSHVAHVHLAPVRAAGFDEVLVKPCLPDTLLGVVLRHVDAALAPGVGND